MIRLVMNPQWLIGSLSRLAGYVRRAGVYRIASYRVPVGTFVRHARLWLAYCSPHSKIDTRCLKRISRPNCNRSHAL